jgi:hypothetical protein
MTGKQYADLVARYIVKNFGERGIQVYREVFLGKTILGKNRRVDIFVVHPASNTALAMECKYQGTPGTTDEKVPYTLEDLRSMPMPVCLAYAGEGFSNGILHRLAASPLAAYCLPRSKGLARTEETRELDVRLAVTFKWWDVLLQEKKPVTL